MQVPSMAPMILLSSKESIVRIRLQAGKDRLKAGERPRMSLRNQPFAPHPSAGLRYRFARALATRINAPAFRQSPLFPACSRWPADLASNDPNPHSGADSRPHGGDPAAGKPLLDIGGLPMIVHVLRRAEEAQIGRVAVATDTAESRPR